MDNAVNSAGSAAATIPATKERSEDEKLFLAMDLNKTDSVAKYIPLGVGRGAKQLIPLHIRASSRNPRKVMLAMRQFRRCGEAMQGTECEKWRTMSKKEKIAFQTNLDFLRELKRDLADGKVSWDDVAPDPAKELDRLPHTIRLARKVQAQAAEAKANAESSKKKKPPVESDIWIQGFMAEQQEAAASTNGNAGGRVSRVTSTSRAVARTPPPPGSNENTNPNSNQNAVTPDEEYDNEEDGESYTGLGSTDDKRAAEAAKTAVKARSDGGKKKRKMGMWGRKLHHQVDSTSEEAVKQAYTAVALANKTLHVPGRTAGQPRRKLVLLEINECNETKAHGGRPTAADVARKKTLVVVSGASGQAELGYVMDHLFDALKHKKSKTHDLVELNDPHYDFVAPTQSYFECRAKARSQPSTKPVPLTQFRDERHDNHSQRRNSL
jgi:hypothetical protein